jgi:cysteine desulfurase
MNGIEVSTGSACSSGIIKENRVLINMGHSSSESLSAIRFSFSPFLDKNEFNEITQLIQKTLHSYL